MDDEITEGEFAETVGMLLHGQLGDPAKYIGMHGWEVVALDIGEIEITTRDGKWRLVVAKISEEE